MQHIYVNILLFVASHIDEGGYAMDIDYGPERQRWKSVLTYDDGECVETIRSVRYHDDKEIIEEEGKYYSITYLDYDVICLKDLQTGEMTLYQMCTDLLGSVTRIVKGDRSEVFKASYDEWGRQTVTTSTIDFIRGYTGHEMLPEFGLVNMNGRMYDPLLGRFLSADDYVQMPESPQGFNRYAYCLNNPMKYTDPSGELFGLATRVGFFKGIGKLFKGKKWYTPFTEAFKNFKMELKVLNGMFKGNSKQIISRFTFELPQTVLGIGMSELNLTFHDVEYIKYFDGATYIINKNNKNTKGITLGSFINIQTTNSLPNGKFEPFNRNLHPIFMHEYGHYIQSQKLGLSYIFVVGIPSFASELFTDSHKTFWTEIDANKRAAKYFSKYGINWEKGSYIEHDGFYSR